mmetsp:Transcript_17976/g.51027  ORF Transcript_17976/g.51027 Transcript_17976/m.51027 type:complete len:245 (+) Transcript_17976:481-1215(+)
MPPYDIHITGIGNPKTKLMSSKMRGACPRSTSNFPNRAARNTFTPLILSITNASSGSFGCPPEYGVSSKTSPTKAVSFPPVPVVPCKFKTACHRMDNNRSIPSFLWSRISWQHDDSCRSCCFNVSPAMKDVWVLPYRPHNAENISPDTMPHLYAFSNGVLIDRSGLVQCRVPKLVKNSVRVALTLLSNRSTIPRAQSANSLAALKSLSAKPTMTEINAHAGGEHGDIPFRMVLCKLFNATSGSK